MGLDVVELKRRLARAQAVANGQRPSTEDAQARMENAMFDRITGDSRIGNWDGTLPRAMLITNNGYGWPKGTKPPWEVAGMDIHDWDNMMAQQKGDPPIWKRRR